jgi:hypothetical protein
MNRSKGFIKSKVSRQDFKLNYFESNAQNPPDKLILGSKEYEIKPGLEVMIPKDTEYQILSKDINSYRVYSKKIIKKVWNLLKKRKISKKELIKNAQDFMKGGLIGLSGGIPKAVYGIGLQVIYMMSGLTNSFNKWSTFISGMHNFLPRSLFFILISLINIPIIGGKYRSWMLVTHAISTGLILTLKKTMNHLQLFGMSSYITPISISDCKNDNSFFPINTNTGVLLLTLCLSVSVSTFNQASNIYINRFLTMNRSIKRGLSLGRTLGYMFGLYTILFRLVFNPKNPAKSFKETVVVMIIGFGLMLKFLEEDDIKVDISVDSGINYIKKLISWKTLLNLLMPVLWRIDIVYNYFFPSINGGGNGFNSI